MPAASKRPLDRQVQLVLQAKLRHNADAVVRVPVRQQPSGQPLIRPCVGRQNQHQRRSRAWSIRIPPETDADLMECATSCRDAAMRPDGVKAR